MDEIKEISYCIRYYDEKLDCFFYTKTVKCFDFVYEAFNSLNPDFSFRSLHL